MISKRTYLSTTIMAGVSIPCLSTSSLSFPSSNHPLLSCCCSFLKNCCRHIRIHAACKKPFADILQCCNSIRNTNVPFVRVSALKSISPLFPARLCPVIICKDRQKSLCPQESHYKQEQKWEMSSGYNLIRGSILRKGSVPPRLFQKEGISTLSLTTLFSFSASSRRTLLISSCTIVW